jgi:hypothetical protein
LDEYLNDNLTTVNLILFLSPLQVYQNVYFGGIFATLWFVQWPLISSSLWAAAVTGKGKRVVVVWVVVFLLGVLAPWLVMTFAGYPVRAVDVLTNGPSSNIPGLFWYYRHTAQHYGNSTLLQFVAEGNNNETWNEEDFVDQCNTPIMADNEFRNYKSVDEQQNVPTDGFHVGCYAQTGIAALLWDLQGRDKVWTVVLYFLPYFHLYSIFGNFLGFTADQQHKFTIREASLSTAQLVSGAREFEILDPKQAFPSGALLAVTEDYSVVCAVYNESNIENFRYCEQYASNCPVNPGYNFCSSNGYWCPGGRTIDAPSVHMLFFHLLILTAVYMLLAGYWGIAFVSGNQRFYFPFLWTYWFPRSDNGVQDESDQNVEVKSVAKRYGAVAAVKDVSLRLERGEITALLGKCHCCLCFARPNENWCVQVTTELGKQVSSYRPDLAVSITDSLSLTSSEQYDHLRNSSLKW